MEPVTKHYLIFGRVQGVGFRAFTKHQADELKLVGWVRNTHQGQVEAVATGPLAALSAFEQRLNKGPLIARVDRVQASIAPTSEDVFSTFEVRRDEN